MGTTPPVVARARRESSSRNPQLRAKSIEANDGPGWIEGYAATWDNVDLMDQTMRRGCFARSVRETVPLGRVKLMARHFRDGGDALECIGTITKAREDDYGLWIHAELSSIQSAQDIRTLILEGHVRGLSVGFIPLRWDTIREEEKTIIAHTESMLGEVTVTVKPVNDLAEIETAKSIAILADVSSLDMRRDIQHRRRKLAVVELEALSIKQQEFNAKSSAPRPPLTPRERVAAMREKLNRIFDGLL